MPAEMELGTDDPREYTMGRRHLFPWRIRRATWAWILPGLAAAALCFHHLGGYRPLTSHEVLVAQTAKEMLRSGNWIIPTYFGEVRYKKPPLAYWMTAASYWCWNRPSEWSARFPAALAGVLLVLAVARWTARHFDVETGAIAGFCQATSLYFLIQARLAEADMMLALSVSMALFAYGETVADGVKETRPTSWRTVAAFWVSLAVSTLAKGPIGLLLVAGTVTSHALWSRNTKPLGTLCRPWGFCLFLVVALAWPLAILVHKPEIFAIWRNETWHRMLRDPNAVVRYPLYYPLASLWLTLPWTPLWIAWLARSAWIRRKDAMASRPSSAVGQAPWRETLLICWLFVPMAILSLSAGKQEHYLIPALTPCSIWAARAIRLCLDARIPLERLSTPARLIRRHGLRSAAVLFLGILACQQWLLPLLHGRRSATDWLTEATQTIDAEDTLLGVGHNVHWLGFYANQRFVRLESLEELFHRHARDRCWILATARERPAITSRFQVVESRESPLGLWDDPRKIPVLLKVEPSLPATISAN